MKKMSINAPVAEFVRLNCPNGTIEIISKTIITEDGKKKRAN